MRTTLAIVLAALSARPLVCQGSSDTTRYVILFSDRPAGFYKEWVSEGVLHSVFEYNDRGRGPHQEAVLRVDADDFPTAMTIAGHNYVKDTVDERLAMADGRLTWANRFEHGSQQAFPRAFYLTASETPTGYAQLVLAALKQRGPVALLPSGAATSNA